MPKQILNEEKIVATAITLITNGREVTFSSVAKQLGTRSQALYTYFANADELRYAVVASVVKHIADQLKSVLFGQSGKVAIVKFAQFIRQKALSNVQLSRFVLAAPRTNDIVSVVSAFDELKQMLDQLLGSVYSEATVLILASRCIRDLIIGDVLNVGAGWFTNPEITPDESFEKLLDENLAMLARMNVNQG
jgi:AcrR family transcriptional regulator